MHVKVLLFKGLERYINLYMYSLLHVLLSIFIDTIYCYLILSGGLGCVTGYQVIRVIRIFAKTYPFE